MAEAQKIPRREEVPVEHTWDLTTVYPDDAAWEADVERLTGMLPGVLALRGTVGMSAGALLAALTRRDEVDQLLWQLYSYANCRRDSDTTDPKGQALAERVGSLVARVSAAWSFLEPEILQIPETTLDDWQKEEPGLQKYAYALQQISRQRPYIRSAEVEEILAQFSDITRAPGEIFEMLTDADLDFPSIKDETGQTVKLSHARYGRFQESADRRVRRDAFKGYYSAFHQIRNTLGTSLAAQIRSHVLAARIRGYSSALEAALFPNEIPTEVYTNLLKTVEANLGQLHRYVALRKKILGLDTLHPYDLAAPLVPEADIPVLYPEASRMVSEALAPLGSDYQGALKKAFTERWIDVYENVGKRSGAYSDGSYSTAPFILLNYQNRLDDAFTLAHELGHSLHSYFTRRSQPFVYGNYTIFVAEVASTVNESLLFEHLLATREEPALRKNLIVKRLEDIRTTILRQTMFAAFELEIHKLAEEGEALTAELFSQRYYELVSRYHGPALTLDEEIALEWSRIPHFYYNFYVYQYATGLSAALALSRQILEEGAPARERYLRFLSGGSSRPSIELLRDAGVDMTSPAPVQAAMDTFSQLLDQLEALS